MEAWSSQGGRVRPLHYVTVFDPMEREILGDAAAHLCETLIKRVRSAPKDELAELTGMPSGHKEAPADPGMARLLPDFEREGDEEYEGDNSLLRSLHEQDICREKIVGLMAITNALGPDGSVRVEVGPDEVHNWLRALNDLRLYLSETDTRVPSDDMVSREFFIEWLAFCQESLLEVLLGR